MTALPAIRCEHSRLAPLDSLTPHPKNPNTHSPEQIERLAEIIAYQGFRHPIVVSKRSGFIVAGHGRLAAAERLGMREVPVDEQDFESDEAEYAFLVSDNAIAEWALLDLAAVNLEVPALGPDFDINMLGIKDFTIDAAERDEDPDAVPEPPKVAKTKRGELWLLGEHRVLCGDAVSDVDIQRLTAAEKGALAFTSPPYNAGTFHPTGAKVNVPARTEKYMTVTDDMSDADYEQFLGDVIKKYVAACETVMINVGLLEGNKRAVVRLLGKHHATFKDTIYWRKATSTPHIQPGIMTMVVEPIFCFGEHNSRCFRGANFRGNFNNVIEGANASGNEFAAIHAATFPVYLPQIAIEQFTQRGALVVDPFGGSGTTLIACEATGRRCAMMELDPLYVDVILQRFAAFSGVDPVREDGVKWSELQ